jgi:hypothetical protein
MKKNSTNILLIVLFFCSFNLLAQDGGGIYSFGKNDEHQPCLTEDQYQTIERECNENTKAFRLAAASQVAAVTFSWPLRAANGLNDCSYYCIGAYVDQDPASSAVKDFNCGSTTYDGHNGTDIALFPFPFYKMDHNQVEVIAAAAGTIVTKTDGNFDKNCGVNALTPNYIVLQQNSLTSKIVGDAVAAGEYLGSVGSSGSSGGPHLHFEVWSGSTVATLNDPYSGTCNSLNASSWWANQKLYREPAIVKASLHTAVPVMPACPATETPNEDSCFQSGATAVFAIYLRNETTGMVANCKILNPNGTTFTSWSHTGPGDFSGTWWYWNKTLPVAQGTYTFETTMNGITCSKHFTINCSVTGTKTYTDLSSFELFPNPANNSATVNAEGLANGDAKIFITNTLGQVLMSENITIENNVVLKNFSMSEFTGGIYFFTLETEKGSITRKITKQ